MNAREYLRSIIPSRDQVQRFITKADPHGLNPNRGWTFDSELGWGHADSIHDGDGIDESNTFYHYEALGARRMIYCCQQPCRIHTYGDSFTHCDQVNDGQTWQEYLASHLQEPIRNYGVGGYSVYQAYRRMKKVDTELDPPQRGHYIILNIYDDDHFRNLDSWRRLRFGRGSNCGFTLPHLRVNVTQNRCEQRENLITNRDEVYRLCDLEYVCQAFENDPILNLVLATWGNADTQAADLDPVPVSYGLTPPCQLDNNTSRPIRTAHTEAALFATQKVVEMVERFCRTTAKKMLVILSYGQGNMIAALRDEARFDQTFVDWLATRDYPVVDMRDCFAEAFARSRQDVTSFLTPYYIGHHTPAGNYFTAEALRKTVVQWLEPKPRPYLR